MRRDIVIKTIKPFKVLTIIALFIIVILTSYTYGLSRGMNSGKQYILDNQILSNDNGTPGFYFSTIDNENYQYWYDKFYKGE